MMLKYVAQVIPNFRISLFFIPMNLCEGMEKKTNALWWGRGPNEKGIKWMIWEKWCKPKTGKGLGFRSLQIFNIAILAKEGWRIMKKSNPLVSGIMKAKYYPSTNF